MINRDSAFVIGSYVAGCIARATRLPAAGESVAADFFVLQPGGKGFNLLVGLHRLGAAVDGVLPVGDDLWGRMSSALLEELGLPPSWLLPVGGPSGGAVGMVDGQGENRIAIAPGANGLLAPRHLWPSRSALENAAIVAGQFEVSDDALLYAFTTARAAKTRTFLNPSPCKLIPDELLALTDIIVLNGPEAQTLARQLRIPCNPERGAEGMRTLASQLHTSGVDIVIVTQGAKGAIAFEARGDEHCQPAYPVAIQDTTGAGDAFNAGLIAALLENRRLDHALRDASACGALVASAPGVLDNLPSKAAMEAFLR